jgi:hypothetical protein
VPDLKPPRVAGDERGTLLALLQYHRDSIVRKVEGIDDATAAWAPVASGTSLLWLLQHLAGAERLWIVQRFAGEADAGMDARADTGSVAAAVDAYQAGWARVAEIVAATPSLDEPCRAFDEEIVVDLRWVLAHLLEETARHAGHADIIRELIDGATGR